MNWDGGSWSHNPAAKSAHHHSMHKSSTGGSPRCCNCSKRPTVACTWLPRCSHTSTTPKEHAAEWCPKASWVQWPHPPPLSAQCHHAPGCRSSPWHACPAAACNLTDVSAPCCGQDIPLHVTCRQPDRCCAAASSDTPPKRQGAFAVGAPHSTLQCTHSPAARLIQSGPGWPLRSTSPDQQHSQPPRSQRRSGPAVHTAPGHPNPQLTHMPGRAGDLPFAAGGQAACFAR